jgi:hypothetical protein
MPIVPIPWPKTPSQDQPQRAGIGAMKNVIMEQISSGDILYKRAPGVSLFAQSASGSNHCRGFVLVNAGTVLAIFNGFVEAISLSSGVPFMTPLGQLDGSRIVSTAINNKTPTPDIVCVTENGAFTLHPASAPTAYPDGNIGFPNSVTFGDGYFFFTYGNGVCIASALNGTSINLLNQITVNSASDGLVRGIWFAQTLFLFTPSRCEAWTDTANPTGFPFSRSAVIPRGLINAQAIAGFESNFTSSLIWVGSDSVVYLMRGYAPYRISTNDMERRIQAVADKTTLRANVYMNDGHAYWQLSSSDFTFTFDLVNTVWQERTSYGQFFSRIEQSLYAFGKWIVGDFSTGNIGVIDGNAYAEYGGTLEWELTSLPVIQFPMRSIVPRADFNFITGTGQPAGMAQINVDPVVGISWSEDGGATFKMPLQRTLGKGGKNGHVVSVLQTGQTSRFGRVWKLEVFDPVYVGLLSATQGVSSRPSSLTPMAAMQS